MTNNNTKIQVAKNELVDDALRRIRPYLHSGRSYRLFAISNTNLLAIIKAIDNPTFSDGDSARPEWEIIHHKELYAAQMKKYFIRFGLDFQGSITLVPHDILEAVADCLEARVNNGAGYQ